MTTEQVDAELRAAHLVGMSPEEATIALGNIRLPKNKRVQSGPFDPKFNEMGAIVVDAKRGIYRWNIQINVKFDSTRHVSSFDTEYVAEKAL